VAPPAVDGEWEIRFGTNEAAKGWDEMCQQAATNARAAWVLLRADPRPPEDRRHTRLRGAMGGRLRNGERLEQWQIEITGGGRLFYLVDDRNRTVWIEVASLGHPKQTERKRR
jgi:hypothetical protein